MDWCGQNIFNEYIFSLNTQNTKYENIYAIRQEQDKKTSHRKLRLYWSPFFSDHHISFPFQTNDPQETNNLPLQPNISRGVITRHTSSQTLRQLFRANGVCFGDLFVDNSFWLSRGVACYCVSVKSKISTIFVEFQDEAGMKYFNYLLQINYQNEM
ncbi:Hypothetical_protein [Hexamita inflata]|uniref:Hypothetical_protein n=1 Tax=Hexamita inflata TaxID=28002 RepID=A0AA86RGH9_9EUKA|nr:Hypothetical protein HINF_LOCUS59454 [Hexamita inflata]